MRAIQQPARALAALIALALVAWSVAPASAHVPKLIETSSERAEEVAEHGHAHGDFADTFWGLHGHAHDVVDHDHAPAVLIAPTEAPDLPPREAYVGPSGETGPPSQADRIDRPPRA